jgi:HK97 gp10 family phage protein
MTKSITGRFSLEPDSYKQHKAALKQLEKAVRKEIIEKALMTGGKIVHEAAESKAPGKLAIRIIGGRSLRKRVDANMTKVVRANGKFCAIGPDKKHWHYRFFEFGATRHDIVPKKANAIAFKGNSGFVITKKAFQTGGVRMRPFLRPAVDQNANSVVVAMGDVLAREIEKAAKA